MNTPEENQFDNLLRDAFTGFRSAPDAGVWPGIQAAVRTRLPLTRWQRLRPVGTGMLLGALLMGLVPHDEGGSGQELRVSRAASGAGRVVERVVEQTARLSPPVSVQQAISPTATATRRVSNRLYIIAAPTPNTQYPTPNTQSLTPNTQSLTPNTQSLTPNTQSLTPNTQSLTPNTSTTSTTSTTLTTTRWHTGLALDTALYPALARLNHPIEPTGPVESAPGFSPAPTCVPDTAAARQVRGLLLAENAVLRTLSHRNDSLLRTLSELPVRPTMAAQDSMENLLTRPPLPAPRRWALALATDWTGSWGTLPGLDAATPERLRSSQTTSVALSRQLTDRWRLRAGLGQTTVRTQLDAQRETTTQHMRLDTATVTNQQVFTNIDTTYLIRINLALHIEPRYNDIGQTVGYDSTYIPIRDTTFQVIMSHDTVRTTQRTVTQRLETVRERQTLTLRPEYRFWTIPVAVQYALLMRGRLRLGVSAGGQALIFRGGTRPVFRNGDYGLERVGPRDGPFRPVSLAWQASADIEWRLSPRLSASVSPGLRGWLLRPEKNLTPATCPLPSVQLGLMWGF